MSKIKWGEKKYYKSFKDDSFVNTIVFKAKKIPNDYRYLPRSLIVKIWRVLLYYFIAAPILFLVGKIKYGVKVKGKKNLKIIKGGAFIIGNHSHTMDCAFTSVFTAFPKRNYFIANKDSVQVAFGKYFTKSLGALPLPDDQKGLLNLSNAVETLVKKGNFVTIYPEAAIWPYYTKLRPMASASFHYAVKANVPVVPVAVTYRFAKGRNYKKKKPKVNVIICKPIYPKDEISAIENKKYLSDRTTAILKSVIETKENVALYDYLPVEDNV